MKVPSLSYGDLEKARGIGGIRPQVVNQEKNELELGESMIRGRNIIFNFTPSPGRQRVGRTLAMTLFTQPSR
ncbi:MAG: hypothetical protein JRN09_02925 [Nitrososphaerota archaeon]|jgi:malate dehydrogenase (quinone)|nr:hypothetical protein [Nitrososphaerota archaeon]